MNRWAIFESSAYADAGIEYFSCKAAQLPFYRIVKPVGQRRVELFQHGEFMRYPVFIVKTGINQSQAVVGLREVRFQAHSFFKRDERLLILTVSIVGISQSIESIHT